jgi:hypothetical protein
MYMDAFANSGKLPVADFYSLLVWPTYQLGQSALLDVTALYPVCLSDPQYISPSLDYYFFSCFHKILQIISKSGL